MVTTMLNTPSGAPLGYLERCSECAGAGYVVPLDAAREETALSTGAAFIAGLLLGTAFALVIGWWR